MSGVTKIAARTPEDLGSTKIDATAVVNEKSQVTAPQYNRLADYVIELQAAVGTAVDPAPGSITQRIDAVSDPNKIYDDAGTTRVETEEETGHVTTTADGHRVIDAGRYETTIETDTSDVLGEGTLAASKLHLLNHEDGLGMRLGVEASAEFPGEDPVEFFSGVSSKIEGASLGTWGGGIGGPTTSKTTIVVGHGTAVFEHAEPGEDPYDPPTITRVPVWDDMGPSNLPAGMTSLVQGLSALDATKPQEWSPTMSLGTNASSASMNEASWKDEGDFVTIRGDLAVTPTASGYVEVSAPLTGLPAPDGAMVFGVANTGFEYFVPAPVAVVGGNILFTFTAPTSQATRVGFTVTYKKAAP